MITLGNLKEQLKNSKKLTPKEDNTPFENKSSIYHNHFIGNPYGEKEYVTVDEFNNTLKTTLPTNFTSIKKVLRDSIQEYTRKTISDNTPFSSYHTYLSENVNYDTIKTIIINKYQEQLDSLNLTNLGRDDNLLSLLVESHCLRKAIEETTGKDLTGIHLKDFSSLISNSSKLTVNMPEIINQYNYLLIKVNITNFNKQNNYALKISSDYFETIAIDNIKTANISKEVLINKSGVKDINFELTYTNPTGESFTYNYKQVLTVNEVKQQELLITKHHYGTLYNNHNLSYSINTYAPTIIDNVQATIAAEGKTLTKTINNNKLEININDLVTDKGIDITPNNLNLTISIPETTQTKSKTFNEEITYQSYIKQALNNEKVTLETPTCASKTDGHLLTDWTPNDQKQRPNNYETTYAQLLKGAGYLTSRLAQKNKQLDCKTPISMKINQSINNTEDLIAILEYNIQYKTTAALPNSMRGFKLILTDQEGIIVFSEENNETWSTESGYGKTIIKQLAQPVRFNEFKDYNTHLAFNSNLSDKINQVFLSEFYITIYYIPVQQFTQ